MKTLALALAAVFTVAVAQSASAANIFVRNAKGVGLDKGQAAHVTDMVKRSVSNMPEHTLVTNETEADFVLVPTLISRADEQFLRVEKEKDGQVMAMAEEPIRDSAAANDRTLAATESALQGDDYVADDEAMKSEGDRGIASVPESSNMAMDDHSENNMNSSSGTTMPSEGTMSDTGMAAAPATGEVAAPSPALQNPNRAGFFAIGVGPSFGLGLDQDDVMYNVIASYNRNVSDYLTGKIFGDLNFGAGSDSGRFINVGFGADVYPATFTMAGGKPYVSGDVGYGFTRNNEDATKDAISVGAGAGFRFMAQELNMDVNLHYTLLTAELEGKNPSVLGLRAAVNF